MSTYRNFVQTMLEDKFTGATIKALLVDDSYPFDEDTHEFVSDVVGSEISPSGYSRQTLTSVGITYDPDSGLYVSADDIDFGLFNQVGVLGPIFYIDNGSDATNELICADVEGGALDLTTAVSTIYRIDPAQGFLLANL